MTEGHERVTTNEIARRAGVSIGSLYQYFPDKSAMMKEILSRQLDKRRQVITVALEESRHKPLPELIRIIIHGVLDAQKVSPRLYQALAAYGDRPILEAFDRDLEVMFGDLLRTTSSPVRPRDPDLAAMIIVRAFTGLVRASFQRDPGWARRPEVEEELVALALRYLLPDG